MRVDKRYAKGSKDWNVKAKDETLLRKYGRKLDNENKEKICQRN